MANQLDLSGKLIIKVQLGEDIRRIPIHNEDITYDELVLMMQRVFRGQITTTDDLKIKYKDEDNDLITIFDSSDLSFAIQCSRILKLKLFVNGKPKSAEGIQISNFQQELRSIRDRVNGLLDSIEPSSSASQNSAFCDDRSTLEESDSQLALTSRPTAMPPGSSGDKPVPVSAAQSKEFDPLNSQKSVEESTQNKVLSSFGISSDAGAGGHPGSPQHQQQQAQQPSYRSATPDSLSSMGSSASNRGGAAAAAPQQPQQQQYPPAGGYGSVVPPQPGGGAQAANTVTSSTPQQQAYSGSMTTSSVTNTQSGYQQYPGTAQGGYQQQPPQQPYPGATGSQTNQAYPQQYGQNYAQQPQQQQTSYPGYAGPPATTPAQQPQTTTPGSQQPAGPPQSTGASSNPYSRGPSYGQQYPRPQGQYPQHHPGYTQPPQ